MLSASHYESFVGVVGYVGLSVWLYD
ncbi:hypothetical protein IFVP5_C280004 [Vibrio parahaemolyticus]